MKIPLKLLVPMVLLWLLSAEFSMAEPGWMKLTRRCSKNLTDGMAAFFYEDYDQAIVDFELFLAQSDSVRVEVGPTFTSMHPLARAKLADSYFHIGQFEKAFYLIHDAHEFHRNSALIDSLTSVISTSYYRECLEAVEKTGTIDDRLALGHLFATLGMFAEAKQQAVSIVESHPESAEGQYLLGKSIYLLSFLTEKNINKDLALKQKREAMGFFIKARDMGISNPELYYNLGAIYGADGDFPLAVNCFGEGIDLFPKDDRLYGGLSTVYLMMSEADDSKTEEYLKLAKKYLRIAQRIRPERRIDRNNIFTED